MKVFKRPKNIIAKHPPQPERVLVKPLGRPRGALKIRSSLGPNGLPSKIGVLNLVLSSY